MYIFRILILEKDLEKHLKLTYTIVSLVNDHQILKAIPKFLKILQKHYKTQVCSKSANPNYIPLVIKL